MRRRRSAKGRSRLRRLTIALAVDAVAATGVVIIASIWTDELAAALVEVTPLPSDWGPEVVIGLALLIALPFLRGILRSARDIGAALTVQVMPAADEGKLDLAAAPRRVMTLALQLLVVLAVVGPMAALTAPFVPGYAGVVVGIVILVLAVYFLRSAAELQGHVRAASEAIVQLLAAQTANDDLDVGRLFPGLEHVRPVALDERAFAVDKTLGEVDLRARTGVSVLAIRRGESGVLAPGATDRLQPGDVLALAGPSEAVEQARTELLRGPAIDPP
jgi:CPA2 family monovalent cation:H+ antiporter-2